jgi:hypothetical protein
VRQLILVAALCIAFPCFAQERISDEEINARLQVVIDQRNAALDQLAIQRARVIVLEQEAKKIRTSEKKKD